MGNDLVVSLSFKLFKSAIVVVGAAQEVALTAETEEKKLGIIFIAVLKSLLICRINFIYFFRVSSLAY